MVRPSILRLSNESVYRALLREAIDPDPVFCIAAFQRDRPIGYMISCRDWHSYKRTFLMRHPRVLLQLLGVLGGQILRRRPDHQPDATTPPNLDTFPIDLPALPPESPIRSMAWSDRGPSLAKVIYIGVDPRVRSRGIGQKLHRYTLEQLARAKIERLDANLAHSNLAAIKVCRKVGWTVVPEGTTFFATIAPTAESGR